MGKISALRHTGKFTLRRFKASVLLEVIVASVIFLLVFAASMETLTHLTVNSHEGRTLVEVDHRMKSVFREFSAGEHQTGRYVKDYQWGSIAIVVAPYQDYGRLNELTLTATVENSRKTIIHKYIIEKHDEAPVE